MHQQVNTWLCGWNWTQGFDLYNCSTFFKKILSRDMDHLMKRSKNIFKNRLANLLRRPLSYVQKEIVAIILREVKARAAMKKHPGDDMMGKTFALP